MDFIDARKLALSLRENTEALLENNRLLRRLCKKEDKETHRVSRREQLRRGVPYTRAELLAFKRPDLVMLAAQLGIKDTSRPQIPLVNTVLEVQERLRG